MTKATILMSVYNAAPYLQECIDSVLKQSFTDFEFWIVDDGSTDNSAALMRQQTDPRIKLFFNESNLGIAASLNQYLSKPDSKYIFRMDADDICMPDRLKKQIAFMDANPKIALSGGALEYFGEQTYTWYPAIFHADIVSRLLFNCAIPNPSLVIRKDAFTTEQLHYNESFVHPPMEDYAFLIQYFNTHRFANLRDIIVKHREHGHNQSTVYRQQKQEGMLRMYNLLFEKLGMDITEAQKKLHFNLSNNSPDFNAESIKDYIQWSNYLIKNMPKEYPPQKILKYYFVRFFKHLKSKPWKAFQLFCYLITI